MKEAMKRVGGRKRIWSLLSDRNTTKVTHLSHGGRGLSHSALDLGHERRISGVGVVGIGAAEGIGVIVVVGGVRGRRRRQGRGAESVRRVRVTVIGLACYNNNKLVSRYYS